MKFAIPVRGGLTLEVYGTEFQFTVQGETYDFIIHKGVADPKLYQVTHMPSGLRVSKVSDFIRKEFGRDLRAAGIRTMELTRDTVGEARLRSSLATAKPAK